jgi:O-antigen ligase
LSTAIESVWASPVPRANERNLLAEIGFAAFLLLIFVGLHPFAIRNQSNLPLGDSGTGAGDMWRQITYLGAFALIAVGALQRDATRVFATLPPVLAILLLWCLMTSLWAVQPGVTMRRAALEIVIVLSATMGVHALGAERAFTFLRFILGAVLIVNFISIPTLQQAVHLPGEADPALVGNWRGLYFHKNITGAVCAIAALLFLFRALETRKLVPWLLSFGAVFFTVMTRSKTSLGLIPVGIAGGLLFRYTRPHTLTRWILAVSGVLLVSLAVFAAMADYDSIMRFLTDPQELTGRVAIWQGELAFLRDHPLQGSGFGSFADTGKISPLYNYVSDKWVQGEAHGHNAYLQLAVTIGGIGFLLAMIAFIVRPVLEFRHIEKPAQISFYTPLFAMFAFIVLHNFVESDYLEGDGPAWVTFVLVLAGLRARENPRPPPLAQTVQWAAP